MGWRLLSMVLLAALLMVIINPTQAIRANPSAKDLHLDYAKKFKMYGDELLGGARAILSSTTISQRLLSMEFRKDYALDPIPNTDPNSVPSPPPPPSLP